jgi:hypothetical protein
MKKLTVICLLVISTAAIAPTAKADNPVNWSFHLETYGERDDDGPLSPPIDTGYPLYGYSWEVTDAQILLTDDWYSAPSGLSGSGIWGPIPFTDELLSQYDNFGVSFDVLISIDSSGYGTISVDNISFGSTIATGLKFDGYVTVVPEPTTMALFGIGALGLLRKER